jgi:hypothetical protein
MAGLLAPTRASLSRQDFLALPIWQQKQEDLRLVFMDVDDGGLKARCIRPDHRDLHPSLLIWTDHAYCMGCGSFWWPDQFLLELGDRPLKTTVEPGAKPHAGPRYIPMAMVKTYNAWLNTHYKQRLEWLFARGLRLDAINLNLIGHNGEAFVIPVLSGKEVLGLRFRRDEYLQDELEDEEHPKYWGLPGKNKVSFYKPLIPDWVARRSEAITLCEGELDALRLAQEGIPAWSLTNGCRSFRPEHALEFTGKTLLMYDQDDAGRAASERICRFMKAKNVIWPEVLGKDVTEFLQRWSLDALLAQI